MHLPHLFRFYIRPEWEPIGKCPFPPPVLRLTQETDPFSDINQTQCCRQTWRFPTCLSFVRGSGQRVFFTAPDDARGTFGEE